MPRKTCKRNNEKTKNKNSISRKKHSSLNKLSGGAGAGPGPGPKGIINPAFKLFEKNKTPILSRSSRSSRSYSVPKSFKNSNANIEAELATLSNKAVTNSKYLNNVIPTHEQQQKNEKTKKEQYIRDRISPLPNAKPEDMQRMRPTEPQEIIPMINAYFSGDYKDSVTVKRDLQNFANEQLQNLITFLNQSKQKPKTITSNPYYLLLFLLTKPNKDVNTLQDTIEKFNITFNNTSSEFSSASKSISALESVSEVSPLEYFKTLKEALIYITSIKPKKTREGIETYIIKELGYNDIKKITKKYDQLSNKSNYINTYEYIKALLNNEGGKGTKYNEMTSEEIEAAFVGLSVPRKELPVNTKTSTRTSTRTAVLL